MLITKFLLMPFSHCDLGYTDYASEIRKRHVKYLRQVLDLCAQTSDAWPGRGFAWTCEQGWTIKEFLGQATPSERRRFLKLVHEERIEVAATFGGFLTDFLSYEELARACDFSLRLGREHGFPVQTAIINDVAGFTPGLPKILARIGVRYLVFGPNTFHNQAGWNNRPPLYYFQSDDGSRVLVYHLGQDRRVPQREFQGFGSEYMMGDTAIIGPYRKMKGEMMASQEEMTIEQFADDPLAHFQDRMRYARYPYDTILLQCAADNRDPDTQLLETIQELNADYKHYEFRLATPRQFFSDIEARYSPDIPIYQGALIDSWSEGVASSARETIRYREAQRRVFSLETRLALESRKPDPKTIETIEAIYEQLHLYGEHTWGCRVWNKGVPEERMLRAWQEKRDYVDNAERLLTELGEKPALASDIRRIAIVSSTPVRRGGVTLENEYYQLQFDREGRLRRLRDLKPGRDWIDPAAEHTCGGFLYHRLLGISIDMPTLGSAVYDKIEAEEIPTRQRLIGTGADRDGEYVLVEFEVLDGSIEIRGRQRIGLPRRARRVDFSFSLVKSENRNREAVYVTFPFKLASEFQTWIEMNYQLLRFPQDLLQGSHNDHVAMQHFAALADDKGALMLLCRDAALIQAGGIRTLAWAPAQHAPERPELVSYLMNNVTATNYWQWQGGEFLFRYALTTHEQFVPSQSYRFVRETLFPELKKIQVETPNLVHTGTRLDPRGGALVRLLETDGRDGLGRLTWPGARRAELTTLEGEALEPLLVDGRGRVAFPYRAHAVVTMRVLQK